LASPALEVEHRERPLRPDAPEHLLGRLGVLGEDARRDLAQRGAEPRELLRRNERETLVERLEHLASLVKKVAPGGVVIGDACVEDEIVVPAGHGKWVELDRAEPAEGLEHRIGSAVEEARRREQLARDEEATRGLGGDLHRQDAIRTGTGKPSGARVGGWPPRTSRSLSSLPI
jgi:hypothetical protein